MPYPLDAETEADLDAGRLRTADLIDFYVKNGEGGAAFLRCWNWPVDRDYPANDPAELDGAVGFSAVTYKTMYKRVGVNKRLRMAASLSSEPLLITLDASRSGDDEDFVGKLVDSNWHQCRMRVRSVLMHFETGALRSQPHWEWHGLIDHMNLTRKAGEALTWEVKGQAGLFRIRGRRMRQRTHDDQQRRKAGDLFYQGTPVMVGTPLIWAKAQASIPGTVSNGGVNGFNPAPGGGDGGGGNRYNPAKTLW